MQPLFPSHAFSDPALPPFRFIDLFAGIGGIRLGLEAGGGRCVYTVESDKFAMRTYNANFPDILADGTRIDVPPRDIYQVQPDDLPSYELLAAGFPCQPFSIAGVSKNLSLGRQHGFRHEKSGNLFFEITRLIDGTRPPLLFLENVKHLRRHDHGRTFAVIVATLQDRGYNVTSAVLDAKPWVPQHRERTFILGLHRDVYGGQRFEFPAAEALPPRPWPTMDKILERAPVDPKYVLSDHLWQYLLDYAAKHKAAGNGFGFGLVGPTDVARTLSARYHKDGSEILLHRKGSKIVIAVPTGELVRREGMNPRRLTPRECARLMGYPDTFQIPVSDTQAYRQFGNSVVVPVIKHLVTHLVSQGIVPIPRTRDESTARRSDQRP